MRQIMSLTWLLRRILDAYYIINEVSLCAGKGGGRKLYVEDRRSRGSQGLGWTSLRGLGGIIIFLLVMVAGHYGLDLTHLLNQSGDYSAQTSALSPRRKNGSSQPGGFKNAEEAWRDIFRRQGLNYIPPKLVLYNGATSTTRGYGQSAMGPFYCPADQALYIDLSFYQDLKNSLGGGGDFAQGYVIAHEVGHHAQNLLGISDEVRKQRSR